MKKEKKQSFHLGVEAAFDIFGNFTSGNTSAQLHKSVSRRKELVEYALSS